MKVYSLIIIFICWACKYTSVDIMPELKRNILTLDMELTLNMRGCFHIHLIDSM